VRSTRLRIEFFFHAQPVTIHKRTPLKRTLCSGLRVVRLRKFKSVLLLTFITLKLRYLLFSMMTLYSSVPSSNTCLKHKNKISTEYVLVIRHDWNKRNRTLNGIVFDSLGMKFYIKVGTHQGITSGDTKRGQQEEMCCSGTFLHVTPRKRSQQCLLDVARNSAGLNSWFTKQGQNDFNSQSHFVFTALTNCFRYNI